MLGHYDYDFKRKEATLWTPQHGPKCSTGPPRPVAPPRRGTGRALRSCRPTSSATSAKPSGLAPATIRGAVTRQCCSAAPAVPTISTNQPEPGRRALATAPSPTLSAALAATTRTNEPQTQDCTF